MYKLVITEPAGQDIAEAIHYIAKELQNPAAAKNLLADIDSAVDSLQENPKRYALVKDEYLASKGLRFMPVHNYLVFYIVRESERDDTKSVTIERILYSRRNWVSLLASP